MESMFTSRDTSTSTLFANEIAGSKIAIVRSDRAWDREKENEIERDVTS